MPTVEQIDWYDTPRYYDMVFDEDTELEANFLEDACSYYGQSRGKRVLEPACGSGRLMVELAERGWRVTGSDLSEPMLDYARERLKRHGLRGRLEQADMSKLPERGPFDLAHCLVSTFKYVDSERAATAHLRNVARELAPGGIYVLGFHITDYSRTKFDRERWVTRHGDTSVTCNIQAWPPEREARRERMRSRLKVVEAATERRTETNWWFRTYDADETRRLLRRVPELEHIATHDFGYDLDREHDLTDDVYDAVLILRKKK